jgi:cation-transporting ATPase E
VLGDLLVIRPGDQVVVDGVVRTPGPLEVDESLLTGESDRVVKGAGDLLYSGSFVVTGSGQYQASRVGAASFANTLTAGARAFRRVLTPLQRAVYLIIRILLLVVLYFEVLLLVNAVLSEVSLLESVQASVVIFGLVPNGLFLAITLAYAAGAVRVAGRGVLVQQANAIESLANVDVLCLDKTGTLTTNRLTLRALHPLTVSEEEFRQVLATFAASVTSGNRTSEAIAAALPGERMRVVDEVPFSSERKWSGVVMATGAALVLGAPEVVLPAEAAMTAAIERWVTQGLRVVLLARAPGGALRDAAGQPLLPAGLEPLGLVVLADELRPGTQETLEQFAQAGVRLKIISGDNPETVAALARQAGFPGQLRLVTGSDLDGLTDAQLEAVAEERDIFGRVVPQQKERLVAALKRRGHHVAMIGDGVNDVLSLKQADLGIAMESGSQATRAVADIVLLGDRFDVLVPAIREGKRILSGMQDILCLFLTRVAYFALLILSAAVVGGFPFTPRTASLLTLFTVGLPTLALAAWAEPRPLPRGQHVRPLLFFLLPAALTLSLAALLVYVLFLLLAVVNLQLEQPDLPPETVLAAALPLAQSALLTFSVFCGLLLVVLLKPPLPWLAAGAARTGDWRPALLALVLLACYLLLLLLPGTDALLDVPPLSLGEHLLLGGLALLWAGLLRVLWRRRALDRFLGVDLAGFAGLEPGRNP